MIKTQKKKIHLLLLPFLTKNQFSDGRSFFFLVNNEKSGKKFYTEDHFVLNYDAYYPYEVRIVCEKDGKDIVKWERFGDFYDECVIDPDVTGQVLNTYEPDLSKVPEGDYYVIIAWFADGSCDISSVRKK